MAELLRETASLTSQNQLTIPAPIRRALKLQGRSRVSFSVNANGTVTLAKAEAVGRRNEQSALAPFLKLLDHDLRLRPRRVRPVPASLVKRASRLVRRVKVDLDAPLPD